MELNESLIITFLLIVIVILIFSNITVSLGNTQTQVQYDNTPIDMKDTKNNMAVGNAYRNNPMPSPTSSSLKANRTMDNDDLLSNDVKKQLNSLHDQFYFNN
jgi:hypothetical protein